MSENQDDFTNRMCELCDKEFDLSDPHYYDEEIGVCYCSEDCYKQEQVFLAEYTPTVYRISRKMAEKAIPLLNKKDIYVEDILHYLNKDAVKRVAGLTNAKGISTVYVSEDRKAGTEHFLLPYNDEYQRLHGNQAVFGNIIIILGDKSYNELPAELKTTDITTITL